MTDRCPVIMVDPVRRMGSASMIAPFCSWDSCPDAKVYAFVAAVRGPGSWDLITDTKANLVAAALSWSIGDSSNMRDS